MNEIEVESDLHLIQKLTWKYQMLSKYAQKLKFSQIFMKILRSRILLEDVWVSKIS